MVDYIVEDSTAAIYVNGVIHWVTSGTLPVTIKPGDKISATFHAKIVPRTYGVWPLQTTDEPHDIVTWFPAMYILTSGCDGWGGGLGSPRGTSFGDYTVDVPVYTVPACMAGKVLRGKLGIYESGTNRKLGEGSEFYIEPYTETAGICPTGYAWINVTTPFSGTNIYLDGQFYANSVLGGNVVCVPQGNHTIKVTYSGYNTFEKTISVTATAASNSKTASQTVTVSLTKTTTGGGGTTCNCTTEYDTFDPCWNYQQTNCGSVEPPIDYTLTCDPGWHVDPMLGLVCVQDELPPTGCGTLAEYETECVGESQYICYNGSKVYDGRCSTSTTGNCALGDTGLTLSNHAEKCDAGNNWWLCNNGTLEYIGECGTLVPTDPCEGKGCSQTCPSGSCTTGVCTGGTCIGSSTLCAGQLCSATCPAGKCTTGTCSSGKCVPSSIPPCAAGSPCSAACSCTSPKVCGSTGVCAIPSGGGDPCAGKVCSTTCPSGSCTTGKCTGGKCVTSGGGDWGTPCTSVLFCPAGQTCVSGYCKTTTTGGTVVKTPCVGLNRNGSLDPTCALEKGNEMYLYGAIGLVALLLLLKKK